MSSEHFDAVVVGTGFGGSVMAYRMAQAGMRVLVLERGKPYPPGSFPRDPAGLKRNFWDPKAGLHGMYNVWSFPHIESLVSSGLGGGSLIYANVLLRKDEKWFVREEPGRPGWEYWMTSREQLDPHYDQVERMMNAQRYPLGHAPYDGTQKTLALREAAEALARRNPSLSWELVNLAVTFHNDGEAPVPGEPIREEHRNLHGRTRLTCRLCGECDAGCNDGAKNTLDYNYLSEARRLGAEIRTLCEVKSFAPRSGGGYETRYVEHTLGEPTPSGAPRRVVTSDVLVIAAGTLGSTNLMLRNRANLPGINAGVLGTHFSGNGDLLTFAVNAKRTVNGRREPRPLNGSYGPVITSAIRMADAADGAPHSGRGFYLEDAGYPSFLNWIVETGNRVGMVRRAADFAWSRLKSVVGLAEDPDIGEEISRVLGPCTLSSTSLPMLGMGRDVANGRLSLRGENLHSDWKITRSGAYFDRLRETMRGVAHHLGATFVDNPVWYTGRRVITVHPLGGCPMGRNAQEGVVDEWGEVFGHPGLYVADGSVMPGPVGANPALTIAATANRFADRLIDGHRVRAFKVVTGETPAQTPTEAQ